MSMVVEVGLSSSLPRADVATRKEYVVQARLNNDVQPPPQPRTRRGVICPHSHHTVLLLGPRTCPALLTLLTVKFSATLTTKSSTMHSQVASPIGNESCSTRTSHSLQQVWTSVDILCQYTDNWHTMICEGFGE